MSFQELKAKYVRYRNKRLQNKQQFQRSINRSKGGDIGIFVMLGIVAVIMVAPMVYAICQSLKPLDELFVFPPRFFVVNPTGKNYRDLFNLMNESWVP
ncbi:MAG: hypothetical protein IKT35_00260, partial [Clostridia bacterium]|nr:hypothetical protein [Clostridia bacterium]